MIFADAVRSLRLKAGLTQSQLAQKADVLQSSVSQYERGDRAPDAQTTVRLGMALELPPEESIAFLAIAGYADERWRDRASQDLESYLDAPRTQEKAPPAHETGSEGHP